MSNFLQRLAAGVMHPQRAIHPSVGSIWSAAGVTGAETTGPLLSAPASPETVEFSSEMVVPPSPRPVSAPTTPAPTEPNFPLPKQPDLAPQRHAPIRTAFPHQNLERPSILEAPARTAVAFQPLVALPQKSAGTAALFGPQSNEGIGQSAGILRPGLRPTAEQFPRLAVPPPRIPAPAAPSLRPPSGQTAQHAQSPTHEPDAIEIHIGRIEVLAAQPRPVQPAAPTPARKSLDLREYLRRERRPR